MVIILAHRSLRQEECELEAVQNMPSQKPKPTNWKVITILLQMKKKNLLVWLEMKLQKYKRTDQNELKKTCTVYLFAGNSHKDNCMKQMSQWLLASSLSQPCSEARNASNVAIKNLVSEWHVHI